jgi:tRNA A-37 threonylcarbamoyl transferase component Bud32
MMFQSTAMRSVPLIADRRPCFVICEPYESYFPPAEYADYDAFLNANGEPLKSERRTRVVLLRRQEEPPRGKAMRLFVLKIYRYPLLPRIRTGLRMSKAEQEFNSLRFIKRQGVPAAEPVAFGVQRTQLGFVRSCFIITSFLEGTVNLSQWRSDSALDKDRRAEPTHFLLRQIGAMFRRLHDIRFFLFTAKTKNLLIREQSATHPEIFFVDVPYARTLRWRPIARWAQCRDLGFFLGNFLPALTESERVSFYESYLPDPLGGSATALRRRVQRAMLAKQNLTPISRLVHGFKRDLRKKSGARRAPKGSH